MMQYNTSRGIQNTSKVSCHISAAIQMIFHILSPKERQNLVLLSESMIKERENISSDISCEESFIISFGKLVNEMSITKESGVDPNEFYANLDINSNRMGDACNSLRLLIWSTRSNLEYIQDKYESLGYSILLREQASSLLYSINLHFFQGILSTQIIGSKIIEMNDCPCKITRTKEMKEKAFPCPLPLPVLGHKSLVASLQSVIKSQQCISGYNWDTAEDYVEEKSKVLLHSESRGICDQSSSFASKSSTSSDDDSSSNASSISSDARFNQNGSIAEWDTTKNTKPLSFPKSLVLQLLRFDYDGYLVRKISSGIDIPSILDLRYWVQEEKCCDESGKFILSGATMYNDDQNKLEEDQAGHYYSFMKEDESKNHFCHSNVWKKIDDEKVSIFALDDIKCIEGDTIKVFDEKIFLSLLGGKTKKKNSFATMLYYNSVCRCET